jgi:hypothetical protein
VERLLAEQGHPVPPRRSRGQAAPELQPQSA